VIFYVLLNWARFVLCDAITVTNKTLTRYFSTPATALCANWTPARSVGAAATNTTTATTAVTLTNYTRYEAAGVTEEIEEAAARNA
jgi:hypothetical protein